MRVVQQRLGARQQVLGVEVAGHLDQVAIDVDGREAVTFLVRVKECIEDPQRLILDM